MSGSLTLDVDINIAPIPGLSLAGVLILLNGEEIFLEQCAPNPGEIVIYEADLDAGNNILDIRAIDARGALSTHLNALTK